MGIFLYFYVFFQLSSSFQVNQTNLENVQYFLPLGRKPATVRRWLKSDDNAHWLDVRNHPDHSAVEGADYFYAVLQIGSPPKPYDVILDTGSHLAYIPCKQACSRCGPNHHHKPYNPAQSSSFGKLTCSSQVCKSSRISCRSDKCSFSISYMEGSSVSGHYMSEVVTLGPPSNEKRIDVTVGCINTETKLIYSQDADGLFGLGDNPIAMMNQFHAKGIPRNFGICFGSDNEGIMTFGNYHPEPMQFTRMVSSGSYFKVKVVKITIAGQDLPISSHMNNVLLDTGSSDTLMPRQAFGTFKSILGRLVKGTMRKSPDGNLCFKNNNIDEMYASIPLFVITLDGGIEIKAPFPNFIYKKAKNHICTTVFEHGNMIIGGNTLMDHFIYFDRDSRKVGVRQTPCNHIKEALHNQDFAKTTSKTQVVDPAENKPVTDTIAVPEPKLVENIVPAAEGSKSVKEVNVAPMEVKQSPELVVQQPDPPKIEEKEPAAREAVGIDLKEAAIKAPTDIPEVDTRLMVADQTPNLTLTWELLLFGIATLAICAYACYRMPGTKAHEYQSVPLQDRSDSERTENAFDDEDHLNAIMNEEDEPLP